MDKQPVGQLPDLASSNNDDEIMVITNSEYSQLKKEKISDLITDFTSTDENNAIVKGTDGKMFVTDFGNASNITEGTLPIDVIPDIPYSKLPDSGITAGTYTYPTDIVINSKGQVTSITEGQAGANNANQDLSNLGPLGLDKINQSKALETGAVSSDADVYADVQKYAHSTFDRSKFEVVDSPVITDDGIASGFSATNYIRVTLNIPKITSSFLIKGKATVGTLGSKPQQLFLLNNNCRAELSLDGSELIFFSGDFTSNVNLAIRFKTPLKQSDVLEYTFSLDVSTGKIKADALVNNTDNYNASKDFTLNPETTAITLMQVSPVGYFWAGSIDLKEIGIFADGNGYFNGNIDGKDTIDGIEIPYVLSKTGSKIVDVAYRDKVQQLYEQTGEALYYTIDEQNKNFTLPMGEIYGMISSHVLDIVYQIGEPIPSLTNSLKSNEIWLEGAVVSRITYAKLFEVYGTTYGAGDGSTTFGLPDLRNRVLWGSADSSNGYIDAGLPNITGIIGLGNWGFSTGQTFSGAFYSGGEKTYGNYGQAAGHQCNFSASKSNSIYGASTTVQPPAIKVRYKTRFI